MASSFGERLKISIFGESHGEAIGVVADGLPAGEAIDTEELGRFLARRAPGQGAYTTQRKEADQPQFLSGVLDGKTTGAPFCAVINNTDANSSDYKTTEHLPRPGHADYTAQLRYGGYADLRGGGHFSGRLTAPLCVAGGIALQILARRGVEVGAHIAEIAGVSDTRYETAELTRERLLAPGRAGFPVLDSGAGERMLAAIAEAKAELDSVGGVVECAVLGLPGGIGDPMFGGVESRLAQVLFDIPAVKGVEFGSGFEAARMTGSEHNDSFMVRDGKIIADGNNHGGILGGITTGMPLIFRVAIKPTPSIGKPQQSVNIETMQPALLEIKGRHDPCIVPRVVPVVEAAAALVLLDMML